MLVGLDGFGSPSWSFEFHPAEQGVFVDAADEVASAAKIVMHEELVVGYARTGPDGLPAGFAFDPQAQELLWLRDFLLTLDGVSDSFVAHSFVDIATTSEGEVFAMLQGAAGAEACATVRIDPLSGNVVWDRVLSHPAGIEGLAVVADDVAQLLWMVTGGVGPGTNFTTTAHWRSYGGFNGLVLGLGNVDGDYRAPRIATRSDGRTVVSSFDAASGLGGVAVLRGAEDDGPPGTWLHAPSPGSHRIRAMVMDSDEQLFVLDRVDEGTRDLLWTVGLSGPPTLVATPPDLLIEDIVIGPDDELVLLTLSGDSWSVEQECEP